MSLPIPLTVRLVSSRSDLHITRELRDLRFRSVAPGGFASLALSLDRPLMQQPDEIAYYGKVYVYDGRNGNTVWEGRLEDPGRGNRSDGQVWELNALGPSAHAKDRTIPLIYVDRRLDQWTLHTASDRAYRLERRTEAGDTIAIMVSQGATLQTNDDGLAAYRAIADCGQALGRISCTWDAGFTSASSTAHLDTASNNGARTTTTSATFNVAGGTFAASRGGGTAITAGHDWAYVGNLRNGVNVTSVDENYWADFGAIVARAILKNSSGSDITSGYTLDTVLASEVVNDLLGRLLTSYDGANATVTTTTYNIEQLAYPDGVTADRVLADLMGFEPGYFWAAWESTSTGKSRFEWSAWPTTVRYECDTVDGYDSPGSADGLYNAVRVRWKAADGTVRTTQRTQTVAELTAAGLTREAFLDLGDDVGTSVNANRAGDQFLAQHLYAPNAGRLTVARPIIDLVTGRTVMPWEVRPGALIRVRGILPRVDALNASVRDGVTVFKVVATEYTASTGAVVLELDSNPLSPARQMADLQNRPVTRRR